MTTLIDRTGLVYGRWTVLGRAPSVNGRTRWRCVCSCGNQASVSSSSLDGRSRSCGCLRREVARDGHTIHGHNGRGARHSLYSTWAAMIQRCRNPDNPAYDRYGGRGIGVCDRWNDFACFLADVGERPAPGYSLDRIDNDGNYEPGNVRWATAKQQAANRRPRRR